MSSIISSVCSADSRRIQGAADKAEDLVIVCGVFIHWEAADDKKIYDYNYQATKEALKCAMAGKPTIDEIIAGKDKAAHPFRGF